jgi:hypothetical protein
VADAEAAVPDYILNVHNLAEQADTVCQPYREVLQTRSAAYERASGLNQSDFLSEILAQKEQSV